jgi:hypothetical protein
MAESMLALSGLTLLSVALARLALLPAASCSRARLAVGLLEPSRAVTAVF